jgi:hypothetical protein
MPNTSYNSCKYNGKVCYRVINLVFFFFKSNNFDNFEQFLEAFKHAKLHVLRVNLNYKEKNKNLIKFQIGHRFPDGSITADFKCISGQWKMFPRTFAKCDRKLGN